MDELNSSGSFPSKIVAVLVLVALLVTIIGTWTVLKKVDSRPQQQGLPLMQTQEYNSDSTKVSFTVLAPTQPKTQGTSRITLNVVSTD